MFKLAWCPRDPRRKEQVMPNNIPDTTVAVTVIPYSVRYIDHTGDKKGDILTGLDTATVTPANVQALNVALGAATNASMYSGNIQDIFRTNPDKNDANVADRSEVQNVINVLAKRPDGRDASLLIRAPVPALFIPNSDEIDPTSTELLAVFTAWTAMLPAGFEIISARYTGRKQFNQATPI